MLTARFIRHGESLANAGGVTDEAHTIPLTDLGRAQASELSRSFAEPPSLIIASPYLRAHDTARPTVERFPHVPFETWAVHEFTYLGRELCRNTTVADRIPWAMEFWARADPHSAAGEGTESFRELIDRVRAALDRLSRCGRPSVTVFSHGLFMKAVHWEIENAGHAVTPTSMAAFHAFHLAAPIANAEGFIARWDGSAWRVES